MYSKKPMEKMQDESDDTDKLVSLQGNTWHWLTLLQQCGLVFAMSLFIYPWLTYNFMTMSPRVFKLSSM